MKRNKKLLILTALVCLLPILAGLAVYSRLPAELPTHFGIDGTPDGWSSRPMAVFGLPCFLAAGNLLLYFSLRSDPKRANMNKTLATLCLWILPAMSLLTSGITLGEGLGYRMHVEVLVPVLVGVIFLLAQLSEVIKAVIGFWMLKSGIWAKNLIHDLGGKAEESTL